MSVLGACLLLSGFACLLIGLFHSSRRWTWFTVYGALFVCSDIADLLIVGPDAMSSHLQRLLDVPVLAWVIGRIVMVGVCTVFWSSLARQKRRERLGNQTTRD